MENIIGQVYVKNILIEVLIPAFCSLVTFVFLWCKLIIGEGKQLKVWKVGIYIGAGGSLFSAIGFGAEQVNPYPCTTYMVANTIAYGCILAAAFFKPDDEGLTVEEITAAEVKRQAFISRLGLGSAVALVVMVIIGFGQGQRQGQVISESVVSVVSRMNVELSSLGKQMRKLTTKVDSLEKKTDVGQQKDSSARAKNFANQQTIIKNTSKK